MDAPDRARHTWPVSAALVLTGAPRAAKSSVLEALTTLLEIDGTAYGAIESEQLAWGSPWLQAGEWIPHLAADLSLQRQAGRRLFLVAATTEIADELRDVVDAVAVEQVIVVCLRATPDTVAARIATREPDAWPGKAALTAHARQLARTIPAIGGLDLVVETEARAPSRWRATFAMHYASAVCSTSTAERDGRNPTARAYDPWYRISRLASSVPGRRPSRPRVPLATADLRCSANERGCS